MDETINHNDKRLSESYINLLVLKLNTALKENQYLSNQKVLSNRTYLIICLEYAEKIKKQLTYIDENYLLSRNMMIRSDIHQIIDSFNENSDYIKVMDFLRDLSFNLESIIIEQNMKIFKTYQDKTTKLKSEYENLNKQLIDDEKILDEKILNADNVINEIKQNYALSGFDKLYRLEAKNQSKQSEKWILFTKRYLRYLMISIVICFLFNLSTKITSYVLICNEIAFNFILLSVTLWCAKMYIHSKSLEINYRHKSISSRALLPLVTSIKETSSEDISNIHIKNTILLESSRMIFAPPETSLNKKDSQIDNKLLETIRDVSTMTKKA